MISTSSRQLGKINEWVTDNRRNLEAPGIDPLLLQLRVLIDKQNGVDNHMYGITTTAWREFLEDSLGITTSIALTFQAALHQCTQHAIVKMWKARNFARHGCRAALYSDLRGCCKQFT